MSSPSDSSWSPRDWLEHIGSRQSVLQADLDAALAYGESHPEVFGGVWWNGPRLQVGLTVPRPHERAILAVVEHPAEVDVALVRWTLEQLADVRADVERRLEQSPGRWQGIGDEGQQITVALRADGEALAAELLEAHGEALELTIGGRRYPAEARSARRQAPPGPVATAHRPDLELCAVCDQAEIGTGHDFTGQLTVHNTSDIAVQVVTEQPLLATLLSADGRSAGAFTGFLAGTGLTFELPAGHSTKIAFIGGTAGGPRYATPPGTYDLVVAMPLDEPDLTMHRSQLLSTPIHLTVLTE